ncbi:MAG: AAA family ATPase, partial [Thiovulaceae bacterium]|nr:AAA family ATPase [Sulfurimonadaceae bacterium]
MPSSKLQECLDLLESGKNLFITGAAGVGKSYTTNAIVKAYEDDCKQVVKLASTAMAATHIGGQTLHSFLELRLYKSIQELETTKRFPISSKLKKILKQTDLIVIDEISMVSAGLLSLVRLRLMQAGYQKSLMVVGDFLQLAPVVKKDEKKAYAQHYDIENPDEIFGFSFASPAWEKFDFQTLRLLEVHRTKDQNFMLLLDDIRRGIFLEPHENYLKTLFKESPKNKMDHTFLFSTNAKSDQHNEAMLEELDSEEVTLDALYDGERVEDEEIDKFCKDAKVSRELVLKEGADVLFSKNSWNYYNGERGKIKRIDFKKGTVIVQKGDGTHVKVERERF